MIFGECPHCDGQVVNYLAEGVDLPVYERCLCEHCGETYWLKHSRIDPEAFPEKPDNCGERQIG